MLNIWLAMVLWLSFVPPVPVNGSPAHSGQKELKKNSADYTKHLGGLFGKSVDFGKSGGSYSDQNKARHEEIGTPQPLVFSPLDFDLVLDVRRFFAELAEALKRQQEEDSDKNSSKHRRPKRTSNKGRESRRPTSPAAHEGEGIKEARSEKDFRAPKKRRSNPLRQRRVAEKDSTLLLEVVQKLPADDADHDPKLRKGLRAP